MPGEFAITCPPETVLAYLRKRVVHANFRADWSASFASSNEEAEFDEKAWREEAMRMFAMANTVEGLINLSRVGETTRG